MSSFSCRDCMYLMISDTTVDLSVCSSQQQQHPHTHKQKKSQKDTQKRESDSQSSKPIKAFALVAAKKILLLSQGLLDIHASQRIAAEEILMIKRSPSFVQGRRIQSPIFSSTRDDAQYPILNRGRDPILELSHLGRRLREEGTQSGEEMIHALATLSFGPDMALSLRHGSLHTPRRRTSRRLLVVNSSSSSNNGRREICCFLAFTRIHDSSTRADDAPPSSFVLLMRSPPAASSLDRRRHRLYHRCSCCCDIVAAAALISRRRR